jgi:hypothetical protein
MSFKERFKKISRLILMIWGVISLLGVIIILGNFVYSFSLGNEGSADKATNSDVRFVLNWCELGDQRIEKVLHSYISARSFTGDHFDAYAIKISNVSIDELTTGDSVKIGKWYRGDQLPKLLDDAVSFAFSMQDEISWFPKESNIRTEQYYIYPWSIYCHGITPSAVDLIFLNPEEKIVYFISNKI